MVANLEHGYTLEEYLEIDRQSEARLEFWNGEIFDMSGVSEEHAAIEINITGCLVARLGDKRCRLFPANMRIKVPSAPPYRYGDLSALCGEAVFEKIGGVDVLMNPSLIIEVLSNSTEKYDRDVKFKQYQSIASFREYLLVRQDRPFVTQIVKSRDRDEWIYQSFDELTDTIKLESVGCEVSCAEIYRNVEFEDEDKQNAKNNYRNGIDDE
ncbi:MAG: Uma2 family endonuclease [Pyrinomonadaceae bacterium MAG19_C2-C3]|nr:Uma2 family endonuclease [Pyrinomonadaceae bacterium MAG19_C2-C3]